MTIQFSQFGPTRELSRFVQYYWTLTGDTLANDLHPIFPDGSPELVFNLGDIVREIDTTVTSRGSIAQPRAMLVGQMTRPVRIEPSGAMDMFGVRLSPFGAAALFHFSAYETRNQTLALDALGARHANALATLPERLHGAGSTVARIAIVERELRVCVARTFAALTHAASTNMQSIADTIRTGSNAPVAQWSHAMRCSARTLERHFDRFVGLAPKEFARIRRFQRALALATQKPTLRWSTIAADTGYADQSHMVRDFRQFAGAAPTVVRPTLTEITATFVDDTARR